MKLQSSFLKQLGPGLLYAGAAVGVSHLVQSTRAGALFGYELLWVIVVAHLVKYPFFLMGPVYAQHCGNSILSGYRKLGKWAVYSFMALTFASMFAVIAAISVVTSGLAENLFHLKFNIRYWTTGILVICAGILLLGKYQLLDKVIRYVIVLLTVTTVVAFLASLGINSEEIQNQGQTFSWNSTPHLLFLVAFVGWMPAPMDISIWHSVWQVEKQLKEKVKKNNLDFNIGFIGTAVLAVLFLSLGSQVFYNSSRELADGGIQFSAQLIDLYAILIGKWAYIIIAIAAFTTMFSTIITCLDAFPRSLHEATLTLIPSPKFKPYIIYLILLVLGSQIIVYGFLQNMKQMVDFATTVSFLTTPLLAWLNYKAIEKDKIPLKPFIKIWSKVSLLLLLTFAGFYLWLVF